MQARGHHLIASILEAIHEMHKACKRSTVEFWYLKALAQLIDLQLNHGEDAAVVRAGEALLPGKIELSCAPCQLHSYQGSTVLCG